MSNPIASIEYFAKLCSKNNKENEIPAVLGQGVPFVQKMSQPNGAACIVARGVSCVPGAQREEIVVWHVCCKA